MSEIVLVQPTETAAAPVRLADCSPTEQIGLRYMNAANALLADAAKDGSPKILVDVLTWTLAQVIDACGTPVVAGDVIHRLGEHICTLAERRRAQQEANQATAEGRAPH